MQTHHDHTQKQKEKGKYISQEGRNREEEEGRRRRGGKGHERGRWVEKEEEAMTKGRGEEKIGRKRVKGEGFHLGSPRPTS